MNPNEFPQQNTFNPVVATPIPQAFPPKSDEEMNAMLEAQGTVMPPRGQVSDFPETTPSQPPSELNKPVNMGKPGDDKKKELLQKLMSNLLGKSGRSVHELINGVKSVIGAYKNYAKEWDSLNNVGAVIGGATGGPVGAAVGAATGGGIQKILRDIQGKKSAKDGGGGPGRPSTMAPAPNMVPTQTINPPKSGLPPVQMMPPLPPANVPSGNKFLDNSGGTPASVDGVYKMPAPVNRLGIHGF